MSAGMGDVPGVRTGLRIDRDRLYTETELRLHGLFDEGTLARARRQGLKNKLVSGVRCYFGRWLIAWLEGEADGQGT